LQERPLRMGFRSPVSYVLGPVWVQYRVSEDEKD
jgi:hypothetical protein